MEIQWTTVLPTGRCNLGLGFFFYFIYLFFVRTRSFRHSVRATFSTRTFFCLRPGTWEGTRPACLWHFEFGPARWSGGSRFFLCLQDFASHRTVNNAYLQQVAISHSCNNEFRHLQSVLILDSEAGLVLVITALSVVRGAEVHLSLWHFPASPPLSTMDDITATAADQFLRLCTPLFFTVGPVRPDVVQAKSHSI